MQMVDVIMRQVLNEGAITQENAEVLVREIKKLRVALDDITKAKEFSHCKLIAQQALKNQYRQL